MKLQQMRHRATIQAQTTEADGMGGQKVTWTDQSTVWAALLRPRFSSSVVQGAADATVITQGITIRPAVIKRGWRIVVDDSTYEVLHIDKSVPGELTLTTKEVVK